MSFLDKPVSSLTLAELQRLIRQEVSSQVPPLPAGVAALNPLDIPVTVAQIGTQGQIPTFHAPGSNFVFSDPGAISDGVKPTASPDLTAGTSLLVGDIGQIHVSWAPVANADPVGYDVHISTVNGFTPTAGTLFGTTMSTTLGVKTLADGTSLLYGTPYYIRIVAFDNDGAAPAGVQSTSAGTTLGTLIGATVETAISGQRVVLDVDGAHLYDSSGAVVVDIPTDSAKTSSFNGTLTAQALTTLAASLSGSTQVASGGVVTLTSGVTTPLAAPALGRSVAGGNFTISVRYFVAYSWYDGTHETLISPVASIVPYPSGGTDNQITVTVPPAPAGAVNCRVYMNPVSTFVAGAGHLVGTFTPVSTTATTSVNISVNSAGAASPATATGPFSTTPGTVVPASAVDSVGGAYGWLLDGSGRTRFLGPTLNSQFWLYDDFFGAAATYTALVAGSPFGQCWTYRGQGAANNIGRFSGATTQAGVLALATGTATNGHSSIGTDLCFLTGAARMRFSVHFQVITNLPIGAQSYWCVMGLTDLATTATGVTHTTAANNGITLQFSNDTGSPAATLNLAVSDGATLVQAVGPLIDLGWHFAEFEVNGARTNVDWWVDGVKQTAITTNIPANSSAMGVALGIEKTAGAISRNLNIDSVALFGDFVSG